ncbi:hypothetical protein GQ55_5G392100 [Panicum hallii var. hallii]|uniref:Uncharacterized protein n=1 Tax=Panicum hallii var. hallii TaxID=1504633 RepID=A0A2T7DN28_9POAL|nr:hypothetical protein GQ55_5G392100 [Panicum hallii var. hallii]
MLAEKGPPSKRKKIIEPSCESSIVPVGLTPKIMKFSPNQTTSVSLGSRNSLRSGSGSNQLELLPAHETTPPPATSKPREKKAKGKAAGKKNKKKFQCHMIVLQ